MKTTHGSWSGEPTMYDNKSPQRFDVGGGSVRKWGVNAPALGVWPLTVEIGTMIGARRTQTVAIACPRQTTRFSDHNWFMSHHRQILTSTPRLPRLTVSGVWTRRGHLESNDTSRLFTMGFVNARVARVTWNRLISNLFRVSNNFMVLRRGLGAFVEMGSSSEDDVVQKNEGGRCRVEIQGKGEERRMSYFVCR